MGCLMNLYVFIFSVLVLVASSGASERIWSSPVLFTSVDQLVRGRVVEAFNPGGAGNIAVGNVVFKAGNGSLVASGKGYNTQVGSPTANEAMNSVLRTLAWSGSGDVLLELQGLEVGKTYKLQLFCADNRPVVNGLNSAGTLRVLAVDRANGGPTGWQACRVVSDEVTFVTCIFTARTPSVSIPLEVSDNGGPYKSSGAMVNAYLLVEPGTGPEHQEPEPALVPERFSYSVQPNAGLPLNYYPSQRFSARPEENSEIPMCWVRGMQSSDPDWFHPGDSAGEFQLNASYRPAEPLFGYWKNDQTQPARPELTWRQCGVLCPFRPLFTFRFGTRADLANVMPGVADGDSISWLKDWVLDDYRVQPGRIVYEMHSPDNSYGLRLDIVPSIANGGAGMIAKMTLRNHSIEARSPVLVLAGWAGTEPVLPKNVDGVATGALSVTCNYVPWTRNHGQANLDDADYTMLAAFEGGAAKVPLFLSTGEKRELFFTALLDAPDQPKPEYIARIDAFFVRNAALDASTSRRLSDAAKETFLLCTAEGGQRFADALDRLPELYAQSVEIAARGVYRKSAVRFELPDKKLQTYLNFAANDLLPALVQPPGLFHDSKYYQVWHYIFAYRHQIAAMNLGLEDEAINDLFLKSCNQEPSGFLRGVNADFKGPEHPTHYEASYIESLYHYHKWTGDLEPVRQLWPVLLKAMDYIEEKQNPDGDDLYLDFLHGWKSDSDSRGPSSAYESALVQRAYAAMAEFALKTGLADPASYACKAQRIADAIQRELWSGEKAMLGSKCPLGMLRLHPQCVEVEIPVRTGVVDPWQAYVMCDWFIRNNGFEDSENNLWLFQSDWWPRQWTQGLNATSDAVMVGLAALRSGLFEQGARILSAYARPAFKEMAPGDGYRVDTKTRFSRAISTAIATCQGGWGRAIVEGLWGIEPHVDEGYLRVRPNLPRRWNQGAFERPGLAVSFLKTGSSVQWTVESVHALKLELPVFEPVTALLVNGSVSPVRIEPAMSCGRLVVDVPAGKAVLEWDSMPCDVNFNFDSERTIAVGERVSVEVSGCDEVTVDNRFGFFSGIQHQLDFITARVAKSGCGRATLFLNCRKGNLRWIEPVSFDVQPEKTYVRTVDDPLPKNSRLVPVNLGTAYNNSIDGSFNHPWEWDHGTYHPFDWLVSNDRIGYWHQQPIQLRHPLPTEVNVGAVPFRISSNQVALIANTAPYRIPTGLTLDIGKKVHKLFLLSFNYMLSTKSYVPTVLVELNYADGTSDAHELVAPFNFDYHAQVSGINTKEYMIATEPLEGNRFTSNLHYHHLTMTDVPCNPGKELKSVTFKSIATETFFGLSGLTLNTVGEQ